jgi:predicted permease
MASVLGVTAPIYLLIAAGYVAVRAGWMSGADMRVLGRFVAQFCVPALLLRTLSTQRLGTVFNAHYLLVYAGGSLLALALVMAISRGLLKRPATLAALQGLGASNSNSAFVGYPIVLQTLGPGAGVALALCMLVENLLIIPLTLALADAGSAAGRPREVLRATALGLLRNPMVVAIAIGLAMAGLQWPVPAFLERAIALAAAAAPPTALFVIGGTLVGLRLEGMRGDITLVVAGKLLLHPLCVLLGVLLLPPQEPALRAAAVLYAAMPMLSIYPVMAQRHGHERLCAAALLAATVGSFATVTAFLGLVPATWRALP